MAQVYVFLSSYWKLINSFKLLFTLTRLVAAGAVEASLRITVRGSTVRRVRLRPSIFILRFYKKP